MSITHRSDDDLIAGYHHAGDRGLGVRGGDIPSGGTDGPGILYSGLSLPNEQDNEFRLLITSVPVGLTIFVNEDSSFEAYGADGTYQGNYSAYKDGVWYGNSTYTVIIAAQNVTLTIAGIGSTEALGSPTILRVSIRSLSAAGGIGSNEALGTPLIQQGAIRSIVSVGIVSSEAFGNPSVAPTIIRSIAAVGIVSTSVVGTPDMGSATNKTVTGAGNIAPSTAVGLPVLTITYSPESGAPDVVVGDPANAMSRTLSVRANTLLRQIMPEVCFYQGYTVDSADVSMSELNIEGMRTDVRMALAVLGDLNVYPVLMTGMPVNAAFKTLKQTDSLRRDYNRELTGDGASKYFVADLSEVMSGPINAYGQTPIVFGLTSDGKNPNDTGHDRLSSKVGAILKALQEMV